ncbi:hypothetical protein C8F01DRAFT_777205 [Mycena amicta]|nr:hypothetical protein C8F01DRAFT_777205 [Mycena amicta]
MLSKPPTVLQISALFGLLWASRGSAILVNITVDDTNATAWTWAGSWNVITDGDPCPNCFAQLDGNRAYNHSWHDGNLRSGSFTFQGVAVYIYGIDVQDPANISFGMSNPPISAFHYKDTGGGFIYDSLFFFADGLDGTSPRTVTWNEESNSISGGGAGIFDYAVVTVDQSATSSTSGGPTSSAPIPSANNSSGSTRKSSKVEPIAGGVVAAVAALVILAGAFYCLKRRHRSTLRAPAPYLSLQKIENGNELMPSASSNPSYTDEPFQPALSSSPPPVSTIPRSVDVVSSSNPKEPTVLAWIPSPTTPAVAHARDADVEQRLRNLEAMVADQGPPAYA